jgi:hypothetical protein
MMKWTVLFLLIACDAGVRTSATHRPHTVSLDALDLQGMPIPLPKHGLAVQTSGMGGYFALEVLDTDARTLRVIAESWDPEKEQQHVDETLTLDATNVKRLVDLAERAWREDPHGTMPQVTDVVQHLFIVDGDDAFTLRADMIGFEDVRESAVRPDASALVLATEKLARATLEPPLPAVTSHRHPHALARDKLGTTEPLPVHGLVVHRWDLTGGQTITIDSDSNTLRVVASGKPPVTRKQASKHVHDLMDLAFAAWHEDAAAMQAATDVREDLYIVDGDEAFYVSGHPISAESGMTGRPAASLLMTAVYRAAL